MLCDNKACVQPDITIDDQTFNLFSNVYYPTSTSYQYKLDNEVENTSLHRVPEIESLIDRFEKGSDGNNQNYIIMNYGYSGSGKTNVANLINKRIVKHYINHIYTYGKFGQMKTKSAPFITSINREKVYSRLSKNVGPVINTESKVMNKGDFYLHNSNLIKTTLNNPSSSRFHSMKTYINKKNGNTLLFFDLASSEDKLAIIREYVSNLTLSKFEEEISNSTIIFQNLYIALKDTNTRRNDGDLNKQLMSDMVTNSIWSKYVFYKIPKGKTDNKRNLYYNASDVIKNKEIILNRLDIIMEAYYISHSLGRLREQMEVYAPDKKMTIPEIGLLTPTAFKKILMFGFVRNDKGYTDKDDTFKQGTISTLEFLDTLLKPEEEEDLKQSEIPVVGLPENDETDLDGKNIEPINPVTSGGANKNIANKPKLLNAMVDDSYLFVKTSIMEIVFLYIVKIIRVYYYTYMSKQTKKSLDDNMEDISEDTNTPYFNNTLLVEYLGTLMLSLGAYAMKNDRLFYAILIDGILSSLVIMNTNNHSTLLIPYFLPVYVSDYILR